MEFLQLKYFCHAAHTESFTNTARFFQVPPSDISQSIKRLETELGVQLFDRSANRIVLNDSGRCFLETAENALTTLDQGVRQVREQGNRLRICTLVNRRIVMQTAEQFHLLYPDVDIILTHQEQDVPDLLITAQQPSSGYLCQKLLSEPLFLAVAQSDPLTKKTSVTAADLENAPFITMGKGNNLYDITVQVCRDMGFSPRIAIQSDDPFYVRQCVQMGLGVAVVPAFSWQGQFSENTVLKKLTVPPRDTYICSRKPLSDIAKKFTVLLFDMCKKEFV